jgi:N-acetylated-alpha-linked acidic dipeptidase
LIILPNYLLSALGTGSDYSAFLQHLGVPTLNLGYGGEGEGGDYHSIYDSYDDYVRFKDSSFVYGVALAKTAGRAVLRLANADVLPFDFTSLHKAISKYQNEISKLTQDLRERYETENLLNSKNAYKLSADPKDHEAAPKIQPKVPVLDFKPLDDALQQLHTAATGLNDVEGQALTDQKKAKQINAQIYRAEQQLLITEGLPQRPWYKHAIYAPGFYTGYGVKTLPGIREAIEQNKFEEARQQISVAAKYVSQLAADLKQIAGQ